MKNLAWREKPNMVTKGFEGRLAREVGAHLRKCPEGQGDSRAWFKTGFNSACLADTSSSGPEIRLVPLSAVTE